MEGTDAVLLGVAALGLAIGCTAALRRALVAGSLGLTIGSAAPGAVLARRLVAHAGASITSIAWDASWIVPLGLTVVGLLLLAARRNRQAAWVVPRRALPWAAWSSGVP